MIDQKYAGLVAGFFFSLIVSLALSVIMTFANTGGLALMPVLITFIEAFLLSYITALIIPVNKIGGRFAAKFDAQPNTLKYNLLSNLPITVILVLILSFALTLINAGLNEAFLMAWLGGLPFSAVAVYIVSILITPLVGKLTEACLKKE
ncbi:MAG: DUF2798 domain-containing protein [Eubacteriaceae bacterium]|jgi:c-di-AMP phosphodiesterase-like protein